MKMLDIGPGNMRIPGFVTVDVVPGKNVDHVVDASGRLPFLNNTFDVVHGSHVIEHLPWYTVEDAVKEWVRVLKPGGKLEVWTVDAYKIMKCLIEYEESGVWSGPTPSWKSEWTQNDPYKWSAGRLFCYKKGKTDAYLHKAMFTPKYLKQVLEKAGLKDVREMDEETECRGKKHGWINLGVGGFK